MADTTASSEAQAKKPGLVKRILFTGGWPSAWGLALVVVIGLRVVLGGVMAGVWLALKPVLLPILQARPDVLGQTDLYLRPPADFLLGVWMRWDAVHYIQIASQGYAALPDGSSAFYPLYPWLVRLFSNITFGEPVSAALIVSTLAAVAAFALLYRLAEDDFSPSVARWSVVALAIYPTALFLVAPYTEGLFLALTMAAFYLARRQRWLAAGALGALASLSRGPGIYTALALAWLAWTQWRAGARAPRRVAAMLAALVLTGLGGLAFIAWRYAAGFPPMQQVLHENYEIEAVNPIFGLWQGLRAMFVTPYFSSILDGVTAIGWVSVLIYMLTKPQWRRPEWIIYMACNLLTFFSKHGYPATPLQSIARYVLALFPAFFLFGYWLERMQPRRRFLLIMASSVLLLIFSALQSVMFFVG